MPFDVAREVTAAPTAAWRLVTDTRAWPRWGPTVRAVELTSARRAGEDRHDVRLGDRGRLVTPAGVRLPFEITELEPGARWAWHVARLPATGHRIEPTAVGCRVVFEVPWPVAGYAVVCQLALRHIAELLAEHPDGRVPDAGQR